MVLDERFKRTGHSVALTKVILLLPLFQRCLSDDACFRIHIVPSTTTLRDRLTHTSNKVAKPVGSLDASQGTVLLCSRTPILSEDRGGASVVGLNQGLHKAFWAGRWSGSRAVRCQVKDLAWSRSDTGFQYLSTRCPRVFRDRCFWWLRGWHSRKSQWERWVARRKSGGVVLKKWARGSRVGNGLACVFQSGSNFSVHRSYVARWCFLSHPGLTRNSSVLPQTCQKIEILHSSWEHAHSSSAYTPNSLQQNDLSHTRSVSWFCWPWSSLPTPE